MTACELTDENKITMAEGGYIGWMSVDQNDSTFYTQDSVVVLCNKANNFAKITMQKVKFAEAMPALDITIDSIGAADIPYSIILVGNNIVPKAMGGPFPQYTITDLVGIVTADSLSFSMKCGSFPLTYQGKVK
ncbi:hypothetical protein AGMMS4956_00140 [Bacteroidia bacterium]|nr:hypothetical protein AGMMS4956_00140 [Bacteroidia bacterium]